jgi:hypothetical protein
MSDFYEDPELERQLESAFRSTRPRRGFEDELWRSLQRRRALREKVGSWLGGVPWIPALATVSAVAVVLVGFVFFLANAGSGGAGSAASRSAANQSQARAGAAGATRTGPAADSTALDVGPKAFGPLPPVPTTVTTAYTGGLELSLSAQLPALPPSLPVYRYTEPTGGDITSFAGNRGAPQPAPAPQGGTAAGSSFAGSGIDVTVLGSDAKNLVGPTYIVNWTRASGNQASTGALSDGQAAQIAAAYLTQLNLPASENPTVRNSGAAGAQVLYPSQINAGSGPVPAVDAQGHPIYTQVSMRGDGQVFQASGPVPVLVRRSLYAAASAATLQQLPNAATGAPRVRADLTSARLVYVAVPASGGGYLEPAILLTGSFQAEGRTYEVAVMVSALDASASR